MSGPYNQQVVSGQGFGQGVGFPGGPNAAQFAANAAGANVAKLAANTAGANAVQLAANAAGSNAAQLAARAAGQAAAQLGNQAGGKNVTQTYRAAETHQAQQTVGAGGQIQRNERDTSSQATSIRVAESQQSSENRSQQLQRNERETSQATTQRSAEIHSHRHGSSSRGHRHHRERRNSESSSETFEGGPANTSSYQQYSAESSYAFGGAPNSGAVYGTGAYGACADPCGTPVEGPRRPGRHQKQVIRLPDQPQGPTRQVRRRLPTPEPDILERVYMQRVGGEVVEEITEIPTTPPPRIQERTVTEPAGPPQVVKRTVRVPPRGGMCQPTGAFAGQAGQADQYNNLLSAGSYGSVQHAAGSFQQQGTSSPTISGGPSFGSGFGNAVGGAVGGPAGNSPYGTGFGNAVGGGFGGAVAGGFGGAPGNFSPARSIQSSANYGYTAQNAGFQQQPQAAGFGGGFPQQAASFGSNFQQQGSPFTTGFSFIAQGLTPRAGLHQATCFYV